MKSFATLPAQQRADFFNRFEALTGTAPVIAEKDFWVCWLLDLIFATPELGDEAVFKGGTSLSKVFNAISRFSEDVDLGISPKAIGWSEAELESVSKNAWTERIRPKLEADCAHHVESHWLPRLEKEAVKLLGEAPRGKRWLRYQLDAASRSPEIHLDYPSVLAAGVNYIARSVKIEFGSLADQRPTGSHEIEAWVASLAPGVFPDFRAKVVALEIERTFWEKATILHADFHRPADKPQPARYARHYADFAALWRHPGGQRAAQRLDLLERVRHHKSRFFASSWAHYTTAVPGTLRFVPPDSRLAELRADYAAMQPMFLSTPLPFAEMLAVLREAEYALNQA
jgi:hypothetical protein